MLTVGEKEIENKTVTLRTRDNVVHGEINLAQFIQTLEKESKDKSLLSHFGTQGSHEENHSK